MLKVKVLLKELLCSNSKYSLPFCCQSAIWNFLLPLVSYGSCLQDLSILFLSILHMIFLKIMCRVQKQGEALIPI